MCSVCEETVLLGSNFLAQHSPAAPLTFAPAGVGSYDLTVVGLEKFDAAGGEPPGPHSADRGEGVRQLQFGPAPQRRPQKRRTQGRWGGS